MSATSRERTSSLSSHPKLPERYPSIYRFDLLFFLPSLSDLECLQ